MQDGRINSIAGFSVNEIFQRIHSTITQKLAFQISDTNYIQQKLIPINDALSNFTKFDPHLDSKKRYEIITILTTLNSVDRVHINKFCIYSHMIFKIKFIYFSNAWFFQ